MTHPLRAARERLGLSQEDLERDTGVSQASISRMERDDGAPPSAVGLFAAIHVARRVGSTVEGLFADDVEEWKRERERRKRARRKGQRAARTAGAA